VHDAVYATFEKLCAENGAGGRVLEIGATPSPNTLLTMRCLKGAPEKIGINLTGPHDFMDFSIVGGNGNNMDMFADQSFDTILSNATLEHDSHFWLTLREIRRVARPGALVVIGVPGYEKRAMGKLRDRLAGTKGLRRAARALFPTNSTRILGVHTHRDYYRFSAQALREVFFDGMTNVGVTSVLWPPRLIGHGRVCVFSPASYERRAPRSGGSKPSAVQIGEPGWDRTIDPLRLFYLFLSAFSFSIHASTIGGHLPNLRYIGTRKFHLT
jgi:SAM-dependent methyltransferase